MMRALAGRRWVVVVATILVFFIVAASFRDHLQVSAERYYNYYAEGTGKIHPVYKQVKPTDYLPISETFPLAASAASPNDIPLPAKWQLPPDEHVPEVTPLLIGFTRDWPILQQAVISYIAAGWPREDIYVVDNSGVQFANQHNQLTLQNPAYVDHARLRDLFGVNVITTPTLLTFAQLQNFFLFTAQQNKWPHYFWSHMDVVAQSDESTKPFLSLYHRAIDSLRDAYDCAASKSSKRCVKDKAAGKPWALRFYRYDLLALVHTSAYLAVGGWDTAIPFYKTDCDMHFRLGKSGFDISEVFIGHVYDVGRSLPDVRQLLRENVTDWVGICPDMPRDQVQDYGIDDCRYRPLRKVLSEMQHDKLNHEGGRNYWQGRQQGGEGEPFWRHPLSTSRAFKEMDDLGQKLYAEKWGHRDCDLWKQGLKVDDAWKVEKDWF